MKRYSIIKQTHWYSAGALRKEAEIIINNKVKDGFEIVSVSFGTNILYLPTVFITICKSVEKHS